VKRTVEAPDRADAGCLTDEGYEMGQIAGRGDTPNHAEEGNQLHRWLGIRGREREFHVRGGRGGGIKGRVLAFSIGEASGEGREGGRMQFGGKKQAETRVGRHGDTAGSVTRRSPPPGWEGEENEREGGETHTDIPLASVEFKGNTHTVLAMWRRSIIQVAPSTRCVFASAQNRCGWGAQSPNRESVAQGMALRDSKVQA
jgi:hypothetical protein